jgi:translocon-associated protein subunit beta
VVGLCLPLGHGGANLIASKTILNEHMVEGKDLTIKYSIYNVGTSAAVNVLLEDSSFPEEDFVIEQGLLTTTWDRIQSSSNVSHVVVVLPREAGAYNISWARLTYTSDESKEMTGFTSAPGPVLVLPFAEFSRKYEGHLMEWLAFFVMSAPTILLPFMLWYRSYSKYENMKAKKQH